MIPYKYSFANQYLLKPYAVNLLKKNNTFSRMILEGQLYRYISGNPPVQIIKTSLQVDSPWTTCCGFGGWSSSSTTGVVKQKQRTLPRFWEEWISPKNATCFHLPKVDNSPQQEPRRPLYRWHLAGPIFFQCMGFFFSWAVYAMIYIVSSRQRRLWVFMVKTEK